MLDCLLIITSVLDSVCWCGYMDGTEMKQEGCFGCSYKFLFAVAVIVLVITQCSCGIQTTLPTSEPISDAAIVYLPTVQPTVTETHVDIVSKCDIIPNMEKTIPVKTLGSVNVRECPSTSSPVLAVLPFDSYVISGEKVVDPNTGSLWSPVVWKGGVAWMCSGWLSK